jgi:hypothetical protein
MGWKITFLSVFFLFGVGCVSLIWAQEDESRFKTLFVNGSVNAYHDERDETSKLKTGESVDDGDNVSTGAKSEIFLKLPGKAYVYLGPHTKIHISRLRSGDKGLQVRLNLLSGDLWCQLEKEPKNMVFEVSSQDLICRCHGTLFEATRLKNAMRIDSFEGSVVTVSRGQVKIAKAGEVTQYIQNKFRYKHRLKASDESRLEKWKTHLEDILTKTHEKMPLKP